MMAIELSHRTLGINFPQAANPAALLWAPHARKVSLQVLGKENIALQRQPFGYWQADCPGLKPGDRYLININGKRSYPDPASLSQPEGVHGPSACINLKEIREIRDNKWKGIMTHDLIIYELHVGTFTPEGSFQAIHAKLDYLKELGVTAIEIMPVAAFPGIRNWGYDGVFPFAVQQSYGGAFELAKLIRACHQKGLAVILDVVYNHLGPEGNFLDKFAPYCTSKYRTPWGKAINFDDAWCDGVRHYFLENALMWLRDFHIDGLRLDAVHAMKDGSPTHFLRELSEHVQMFNQATHSNHFLIGECDLNDTRYINPPDQGGYGLDAQWSDEWHHALHAQLTGEHHGYYADFGSLEQVVKAFNHAWVVDGNYSDHREKRSGITTADQPGHRFVVFTQNHDQAGNRLMGDRLSTLADLESLKLAAGAMMVSPFIPMLFMGEEYAEDSPFLYFVSHEDEKLLSKVRKGRKREFRDFMKDEEPPDPAAEETFARSKLKWDFSWDGPKQAMLDYYKRLIGLRKKYAMFIMPANRDHVHAFQALEGDVVALHLETVHQCLVALMNFSEKALDVKITAKAFTNAELLIYSSHKQWGGEVDDDEHPIRIDGQHVLDQIRGKSFTLLRLT